MSSKTRKKRNAAARKAAALEQSRGAGASGQAAQQPGVAPRVEAPASGMAAAAPSSATGVKAAAPSSATGVKAAAPSSATEVKAAALASATGDKAAAAPSSATLKAAAPSAAAEVVTSAASVAAAAAPSPAALEAAASALAAPGEALDDALELRLSDLEIVGPSAPPRRPGGGPVAAGPGQRVAGRFLHRRTIALGGMGQVIECVDARLRRHVAVKALRPEFLDNPTATGLLEREAQITASLSHPGIVPVHDLGVDPALGPFYVMPLLEGVTLREVLTQLSKDPAAHAIYRLDRLVRAFIRACHAVEHAHGRGIVHCDLKPANVVLGDFSEVVIIDWALAYRRGEGLPFRGGTVGYLALEQLDPHCNHFTARTDVFALGSMLYELLTLQPAFRTSTVSAALAARAKGQPIYEAPLPPDKRAPERRIPDDVAAVCMRALALEPERRYATVAELVRDLQEAADGSWVRLRRVADEAQQLALKAARSLIQSVTPRRRPGR